MERATFVTPSQAFSTTRPSAPRHSHWEACSLELGLHDRYQTPQHRSRSARSRRVTYFFTRTLRPTSTVRHASFPPSMATCTCTSMLGGGSAEKGDGGPDDNPSKKSMSPQQEEWIERLVSNRDSKAVIAAMHIIASDSKEEGKGEALEMIKNLSPDLLVAAGLCEAFGCWAHMFCRALEKINWPSWSFGAGLVGDFLMGLGAILGIEPLELIVYFVRNYFIRSFMK
eukprot:tig00000852_g5058.t1